MLVALSGPLSNFVLAVLGAFPLRLGLVVPTAAKVAFFPTERQKYSSDPSGAIATSRSSSPVETTPGAKSAAVNPGGVWASAAAVPAIEIASTAAAPRSRANKRAPGRVSRTPPGRHTLQLLFADKDHIPHSPPVFSEKITVVVVKPLDGMGGESGGQEASRIAVGEVQSFFEDNAASELELDMARMQYEQAQGAVRQAEGAVQAAGAVAALVVPKSLGYAGIAGVPIQHGLYAAAAGAILYALFGTSRQSATGPSSALAAVAASAIVAAGISSGDDAVPLVAAITLMWHASPAFAVTPNCNTVGI